jgi:hypothetical protein
VNGRQVADVLQGLLPVSLPFYANATVGARLQTTRPLWLWLWLCLGQEAAGSTKFSTVTATS